jgi:hypothetical protein
MPSFCALSMPSTSSRYAPGHRDLAVHDEGVASTPKAMMS